MSSYSAQDSTDIYQHFDSIEGQQRYGGATGFWASPVLYKSQSTLHDRVILFNKSGTLFSVSADFSNNSAEVHWHINIRDEERADIDNLYQLEYMATPTLIGNSLYVLGLHSLFIVSAVDGTYQEVPLIYSSGNEDYFIAPLTYDTADELTRNFYAISKENKIFKINASNSPVQININNVDPTLINCSISPLVDISGHIYFTGANSGSYQDNPRFDFWSQESRPNDNNGLVHIEAGTLLSNGYKGTILTDRFEGLYFLSDDSIDYYLKKYEFDSFEGNLAYDPIVFMEPTSYNLNTGFRYINNHPALLERADRDKSVIVSVKNEENQPPYYPTTVENMSNERLQIAYFSTVLEYSGTSHAIFQQQGDTNRSWGGVTPYLTSQNYMNIMFGDENGRITSYSEHMWVISDIGPEAESDSEAESVNPPLGYSKFQKGKDNVINYEIQPVVKVNALCLEGVVTHIYLNAYGREAVETTLENGDRAFTADFKNLLKHPNYTVTLLKLENGEYRAIQYENISIEDEGDIQLDLNDILHVYESDGLYEIDEDGLYYDKIILHENAQLKICDNIELSTNKLEIGDGASITLAQACLFTVNNAFCNSPINTAFIQVSINDLGTGKLAINNRLEINENSNLLFQGLNLADPSFDIETILVKIDGNIEFRSFNVVLEQNNSVRIGTLENGGIVFINDCVEIDENYIDYSVSSTDTLLYSGSLVINNNSTFGHLMFSSQTYNNPILIRNQFTIGNGGITDPSMAQLTINNVDLRFNNAPMNANNHFTVFGTINVLNSGKCIVNHSTELYFKEESLVSLNGGDNQYQNGAQLIARDYGIIRFAPDVHISGYKPDPDISNEDIYGDRILIESDAFLLGTDSENTRKLIDLDISSTHPNSLRWEGIYINTYSNIVNFHLEDSQISGIDKIYVKYPGDQPAMSGVNFNNCKYGVYATTSAVLGQTIDISILNCTFTDCRNGVYLEDINPTSILSGITASVTDCTFGNDDYLSGFNYTGIALRGATDVAINSCDFYNNGYGIFNIQSSILVGGHYPGSHNNTIEEGTPNNFYNNLKAGIYFGQSTNTEFKSLVYQNVFTGDYSTQSVNSGTGIWANEAVVDIVKNEFSNLTGHGVFINSYSWNSNDDYHGFAENEFNNNNGCELIGDPASLTQSKYGYNTFNDEEFRDTGIIPHDPLDDFKSWDRYILASLSNGTLTRPADMTGNIFEQLLFDNQERFYPSFSSFKFGSANYNPLTQLITTGVEQFIEGLFNESIQSMKQVVEVYPDSTQTELAIDFLYLATRASNEDYGTLRAYLDLKIPTETLATYIKKEEIRTKCYVKEEDYLTAISRLQLILDNPETVADSLFALIDQAYCYMNLASDGSKALPNIRVKTPDFESYMDLLSGLTLFSSESSQDIQLIPSVLKIDSNFPNPFNPETTISYSIPKDGKVRVSVYNLRGQKVKQLLNEHIIAGRHKVVWDGTNSHGQYVSSGLYFVKISHSNINRLHKMMLMK